jgi:serine/threonine protein kinase
VIERDEPTRLIDLVEDTIDRWREGQQPDAASFLAAHPEIGTRRALALDLIHEEWCLRKEAGESVHLSSFLERFSDYRSSVAKMVAVENGVEADPHLVETISESLWPKVGQEYQGFSIVEPLGRGTYARVYLAREIAMGNRPVVIKVSQLSEHEAHLLGKLEHPNIVTAYSVRHDSTSKLTVICMPLLGTSTGLDLLDAAHRSTEPPRSAAVIGEVARRYVPPEFVREESFRPAWDFASRSFVEGVLWIGQELAAGLAVAGRLGIAHQDIKPSNILFAWSGRPMLLDFNLSSGENRPGDRVGGGTVIYMPPERIRFLLPAASPMPEEIDPRHDIFSLGVVLYELLTGQWPKRPAAADTTEDASLRDWLACWEQPVVPPSRLNRAVDAAVDRIVLRCLAYDPRQRYGGADELQADLSEYLSPWQTTVRWGRRNRRSLLAAGFVGGAALLGGGAFWATRPPLSELYYQDGLALYKAGKYPSAVASFTASLDEEPNSPKALFARGQSQFQLREFALAEKDYLAAVERDPRATLWFAAGVCALQRNDEVAAQYFTNAKNAGYDELAVLCNIAICWHQKGNTSAAISTLRDVISRDSEFRPAHVETARLLLLLSVESNEAALDEAIAAITKAESLGPLSRSEVYTATLLWTRKLEKERSAALPHAEKYFRQIRTFDGPDKNYRSNPILQKLFAAEPSLLNVPPGQTARTPPDPPPGALPPTTAVLDEVP